MIVSTFRRLPPRLYFYQNETYIYCLVETNYIPISVTFKLFYKKKFVFKLNAKDIMDLNLIDSTNCSASAESRRTTDRIRDEDTNEKEFDFFMSYSHNDTELLRPIIKLLEGEPFNLKCCDFNRDFLFGTSTIHNIEWGLTSCKAVALFLTPDFLESDYCQHEQDLALTLALENQCKLIPVVLRPCKLPGTLGRIHYLEESNPSVIAKELDNRLKIGK